MKEFDFASRMFEIQMSIMFAVWMILLAWVVIFRGNGCRPIRMVPASLRFLTQRKWLVVTFPLTFALFWIMAALFTVVNPFLASLLLSH